ncbi:MAG: DUF4126 domain-containing protein [Azonexus sp.]|nr:DUF4126 domain-containing protein [Azonexus sp.]MCK6413625.1 DUF4126 domain-containing protein [Azonexus sp.]
MLPGVDPLAGIALSAGLAWASGLRLYLVIFLAGLLAQAGHLTLPPALAVLREPLVIGVAGVLALVEMVADKVPLFDSFWDSLQTWIRIPAGAVLAALAIGEPGGESGAALNLAAGLLGGTITAGTHFAKAGGRLAINLSPEPVSNWLASFGEDSIVLGGLWAMLVKPALFLGLLALFLLLAGLAIRVFWGLLGGLLRRFRQSPAGGGFFGKFHGRP